MQKCRVQAAVLIPAAQWVTAMVMILVTDLSIPLRLGITVVARCLALVWVVAGAEEMGMMMAAIGTIMAVRMVANTTVAGMAGAAGLSLVDTMVADMMAVGTTSRFAAVGILRHGKANRITSDP
jgi:hypothetical protein